MYVKNHEFTMLLKIPSPSSTPNLPKSKAKMYWTLLEFARAWSQYSETQQRELLILLFVYISLISRCKKVLLYRIILANKCRRKDNSRSLFNEIDNGKGHQWRVKLPGERLVENLVQKDQTFTIWTQQSTPLKGGQPDIVSV